MFFNCVFLKKILDKFILFLNNNTITKHIEVKSIVYQDTINISEYNSLDIIYSTPDDNFINLSILNDTLYIKFIENY